MPKVKSEYDENGRWLQERSRVKGALRQAFRLSPQVKDTIEAARVELPPAPKKDGTPGKRPRVRFRCAMCGGLFQKKYGRTNGIQIDHIDPVVPLWKTEKDMTYDEMAERIFCTLDNLQVLCSLPIKKNGNKPSCHTLKTREENWIRKQLVAFLEGEGLAKREDVDFSQFIEAHKEKYKEYLEEKEAKKNAKKRRKRKK